MPTTQRVTKADIIGGRFASVRDVPVPEWDGLTVSLWSLTDGQWAAVESLQTRGIRIDLEGSSLMGGSAEEIREAIKGGSGIALDIGEITAAEREANALAVAYSLSGGGESWSIEDVKAMRPPGVVDRLAKIVYELSGVSVEAAKSIADFRGNGRSDGDLLPDRSRDSARDDASGFDVDPTDILAGGASALSESDSGGAERDGRSFRGDYPRN
jgi:hypothetical protein